MTTGERAEAPARTAAAARDTVAVIAQGPAIAAPGQRRGVREDPVNRLGPEEIATFQRLAGNQAVVDLLASTPVVQRAPAGKGTPSGPEPGGASERKGPSFDSYADLFNGFQDLAAALINRNGAGLGAVAFGKDLAKSHRSLLSSVRTVFVRAVDADPDVRRTAAGGWPRASARLLDALGEARQLNLPGAPLAAVADQIAIVNKRLGAAKGRADVPQAETYEGLNDTVFAIHLLLWENAQMGESGPGIVREETAGRADIEVSSGIREINAKVRDRLNAVKVGSKATSRHAQLVESLRAALILARSEKAGSAYAALAKFRGLEGELRYVLKRAGNFDIVGLDVGQVSGRLDQTKSILNAHYAAVHGGNLEAVLTKRRAPGERKLREKIAAGFGGGKARVAEVLGIEDVQNALDVIQNHLVQSGQPGIWTITNGPTTIQVWEAQALDLHVKARQALVGYMQSIYSALVRARDDYDSIKLGNSRTKLRILGFIGGADDPGSFDLEVSRLRILRDKGVKPLIQSGDYVGAFKLIMQEKPGVEQRVKAEAEYDADLDKGYSRLATAMSVVQVALVSLVPIAGEAALATAPAWAVGLTAVGAGAGGAFVGEGSRQVVTGDYDAGKLASRTWQGTVIGAGAVAPAMTRQVGGTLAAGGEGFAAKGGQVLAEGIVGEAQNLAQGGNAGEGMTGGMLGGMASHGTQLLPKVLQGGLPGKAVQVGVGAGIGEITSGDPYGGAVGALVPSLVTKPPAGGHGSPAPTKQAGGPKPATIPVGGPEPITGGGGGAGDGAGGGGAHPLGPIAPVPGAETTPGTFPPRAPAQPTAPVGAETTPGTFPARGPAQPGGPAQPSGPAQVGAETIRGTFPARPPAEPSGPAQAGSETVKGTFPPRAPAEPPVPVGAETAPGTLPSPAAPLPAGGNAAQAGGTTAPDGMAGAGQAGVADTAPANAAPAPARAVGPGSATANAGPGGTAVTKPQAAAGAGGPPAGAAIRPPTPGQVPAPDTKPKSRPLEPSGKVPSTGLPESQQPVYTLDKLIAMGHQAREDAARGIPSRDAKLDLPADGRVPSTTPSEPYPAEEPTRYTIAPDKPTEGLSKDMAFVVNDAQDGKKYLFKPTDAEYPVDRAEERGIREGEQAPRDVAAPMVAKELGLDAPAGRLATIRNKDGVLQRGVLIEWRESNSLKDLLRQDPQGFDRLVRSEAFREAMTSMDALDYLINNLDRGTNFGNYLYEFTADGLKLMPIDHGLTFTSTKGRASIGDWTRGLPEHYPEQLRAKLEELSRNREAFKEKIRPFVGDAAVDGFVERLDIMVADMHAKHSKQAKEAKPGP